jgi:hypothetical protein
MRLHKKLTLKKKKKNKNKLFTKLRISLKLEICELFSIATKYKCKST